MIGQIIYFHLMLSAAIIFSLDDRYCNIFHQSVNHAYEYQVAPVKPIKDHKAPGGYFLAHLSRSDKVSFCDR